MKIDFFARWSHYIDHMLPIWLQLGDQAGSFLVPEHLGPYLEERNVLPRTLLPNMQNQVMNVNPIGTNPILVAGYMDLQAAVVENQKRPVIHMEHGVGLVFPNNGSYAGSTGFRTRPTLTLAPNWHVYELTKKAIPTMKQKIIGTPKLDRWAGEFEKEHKLPDRPTVAFAFHWDASAVEPEAGTAFGIYRAFIGAFVKNYPDLKIIGHGHPRMAAEYERQFKLMGIEWVADFEDVMQLADVFVNDCSSTMYEFLVTGKPVVILNSPKFRRDVNFGIRFWDYTDIGFHVDRPEDMESIIIETLTKYGAFKIQRDFAVQELYPYLGKSAEYAAREIRKHINEL